MAATMCLLVLLSWSCLIANQASAEEPVVLPEIGARVAVGATTFRASPDDRTVGVIALARAGYSAGLQATAWRHGWLRLQTEFLYASRQVTLAETRGVMRATYALEYLELPLLARADVPLRPGWRAFAAAGVSPGVLVHAAHERGLDLSGLLNSLDLGGVAALGAAVAVSPSWDLTLEARGVHGLTDVFTRTSRVNRAVFLTLGVSYHRVPRRDVKPAGDREAPGVAHVEATLDPDEAHHTPDGEADPYGWAGMFDSVAHGDAADDEPARATPVGYELPIDVLDQVPLIIGTIPCFHANPDYLRQVFHEPDNSALVRIAYTRTSVDGIVTPSAIELRQVAWNDPALTRCLLDAFNGLRWYDEAKDPPEPMQLVVNLPHVLLRELVQQFGLSVAGQSSRRR